MQNTLLDILILGLLVLVFGSIYRKWPTRRLQFWILGWLFVVAHFAMGLCAPVSAQGQNLVFALSISFLALGGVNFILSSAAVSGEAGLIRYTAAALSLPAVTFIFLIAFDVSLPVLLNLLVTVGEICAVLVTLRFYRRHLLIVVPSVATALAASAALFYAVEKNAPDIAVYTILTQIYFMNGVLYWHDFRRVSTGVLTAGLGLFAWAAVFPAALATQRFLPHLIISGELWNIPKYFVEFGMILTLLEDELTFAGEQREEYQVLFDGNPHPMWIIDRKTLAFLKVNDAAIQQYGYSREQFLSITARDVRPPEELPKLEQHIGEGLSGQDVSGPWTHLHRSGAKMQVEVAAHSIHFEGREARFVLIKDITERQRLHDQLIHQAQHDSLTGLPNRLLLRDRMQQALAAAARNNKKSAIICIDLDRFKQINDTYGHPVGDLCLKEVASRLRERLRQVDTVARTGGEEFTVVLGELFTAEDAEAVVADLIAGFREPFLLDSYKLDLAASMGVAVYPTDGTDADALWRSADAAMYRAKRSGGNQYLFVSREISASATENTELEMHMRSAIKAGGFELYYQPQYTAAGHLCGLEALLRLHHPRLGLIQPDRFISIAEESGLIVPIGNWVLEEACRQNMAWRQQGLPQMRIALNVSFLQFMRTDFSAQVRQALTGSGMAAHFLELEMTETTVMRNLENVAHQMHVLSDLNVRFSIDDFGTGYSSLRHLHQLPISTLKIDRSLIEGICDRNGTYSIVQATLSLAHNLEMQVVAEGVENGEQVAALQSLGCDMLQGFFFSSPRRATEVPALLLAGSPVSLIRDRPGLGTSN